MAQSNPLPQSEAPSEVFQPDAQELRMLAAQAVMNIETVRRCYMDPAQARPATRHRLCQAAATLGLPGPGGPKDHPRLRAKKVNGAK